MLIGGGTTERFHPASCELKSVKNVYSKTEVDVWARKS